MGLNVKDYVYFQGDPNIYVIVDIKEEKATIKGMTHRTILDVPVELLRIANYSEVNAAIEKINQQIRMFTKGTSVRNKHNLIYGTILHIDGDKEYLDSCMKLYKEMNIFANGIFLKEEDIKNQIEELILKLTPDIIVITGHDVYNGKGIKDLKNYQNTSHYIEAVREVRKHFNAEAITVIVGACGSHFEALIASGANFSSSPKRINIHTYDPAIIAIKVATTSINQNVDFEQTIKFIENKKDAFGGIETKGKMKILL